MLKTPVALRLGEHLLKRKAESQEQEMKHFVRLYRHMMGVAGRMVSGRSTTNVAHGSAFQAGHRSASPSTHRGHITTAESRHRKESIDAVLRSIASPEPLSMLTELSHIERTEMLKARKWALYRAVFIGFMSAIVLGLCEVTAAQVLLGSNAQLGDGAIQTTTNAWTLIAGVVGPWFGYHGTSVSAGTNSTYLPLVGNGTASPAVNSTFGIEGAAPGLTAQESLPYWIVILVATVIVSVAEVGSLFADSLNTSFKYARTAGIPLHHHVNRRSERFMRNKENEAVAIKESLTRKRVRYVISAIARAAMDLPQATETILGISTTHKSKSKLKAAIRELWIKLRHSFVIFFIRIIASRVLSKFAVPFLATPLLMLWNYLIVRKNLDNAASVVWAAVSVERLSRDVLQYNLKARVRHCSDGALYIPSHWHQALVRMCSYAYFRLEHVHPAHHLAIVTVIAMCDTHHQSLDWSLGPGTAEAAEGAAQYDFAKALIALLNDIELGSGTRVDIYGRGDQDPKRRLHEWDILQQVVFPESQHQQHFLDRRCVKMLFSYAVVLSIVTGKSGMKALRMLLGFLSTYGILGYVRCQPPRDGILESELRELFAYVDHLRTLYEQGIALNVHHVIDATNFCAALRC